MLKTDSLTTTDLKGTMLMTHFGGRHRMSVPCIMSPKCVTNIDVVIIALVFQQFKAMKLWVTRIA